MPYNNLEEAYASVNDLGGMTPGADVLKKALLQRLALAKRNMAATAAPAGGRRELADIIKGQKANAYAALNPDMARRFGPEANRRIGSTGDPYADTPEDLARKAAMDRMRLTGEGVTTDELGNKFVGAGTRQGNEARLRAAEMKANGESRPTQQSANMARLDRRMQLQERMLRPYLEHQLRMAQIAHGMTPLQQAQINHFNAQADREKEIAAAIRAQGQPAGAAVAGPPGAPPPPGAAPPPAQPAPVPFGNQAGQPPVPNDLAAYIAKKRQELGIGPKPTPAPPAVAGPKTFPQRWREQRKKQIDEFNRSMDENPADRYPAGSM